MKVLLLGATGRTGRHVLHFLLQEGYDVHALVRDRARVKEGSDRLKLFEGKINEENILRSSEACEAIISILNISRTSDFPWAKLRTAPDFLSATMKNLIKAAGQNHIQRIIVCSAWGVHETKKNIPFWFRWLINHSRIGIAYADHERQETILRASDINYTIVRPAGLTNSKKIKNIRVSKYNNPKPRLLISRINTAKFIADCLRGFSYSREAVTISEE